MTSTVYLLGLALAVACVVLPHTVTAFYVPGVAPNEFHDGDPVEIKAVKMTSVKRQLPYQYYFLPFCRPRKLRNTRENLGEVLRGDRITNTPYKLNMNENVACRVLCVGETSTAITYKKRQLVKFDRFIRNNYRAHWLLDNLPAATKLTFDGKPKYIKGFPVGTVDPETKQTRLFNHVGIIAKVKKQEDGLNRIVGFEVTVSSVDPSRYTVQDSGACSISPPSATANTMRIEPQQEQQDIVWSYSVTWEPSDILWSSRWNNYLATDDENIHWYSIVNSLLTVLVLSGIFAMLTVRMLRKDIARYNEEDKEEVMEQTGWKLVHGDVFRPPDHAFWLCACLGSGIQILFMSAASIFFSMFGVISPASSGVLTTFAVVTFVLMGSVAGYFSGRMYKTMKGQNWKRAAIATALLFPGLVFGFGFILNLFVWYMQSSGAVPFTTMIALLLIWICISSPLVLSGYFFGFRKQPYEAPVVTNQIPRQVPDQPWWLHPIACTLLGGLIPFGAVFIELFFIFSAIWGNQYYYLFGFLFIVFVILLLACAEIAVLMTYLQLCGEDYHWWWRSFLVSGGSSVYVFLYSAFYFSSQLEIEEFVSVLLYFGYTLLMVLTFWLLTGTIGFFSTFTFINVIYGSIKID
eukprot:m.484708 g.484708  ORF g.484708 m.484708 type:complete len:633 (-) comp23517_c0_seq1:152-2050(-)